MKSRKSSPGFFLLLAAAAAAAAAIWLAEAADERPARPWLRSRPASARTNSTGSAVELAPPANPPANRTARTADVFQGGEGYNIFVTNTCERESMKVNIKTSRPFYGVIHTRSQRQKQACTVEASGETEYNLEISHVLNPQDPAYCGVIRARRESPEDKDVLSVVVAVRFHRNIELSDDKFFLLNCTNRCRKADCSSPSAKLLDDDDNVARVPPTNTNGRFAGENTPSTAGEREPTANQPPANDDECTIWKFPWAITLLWCLGILLLAMIISHCIMCSSMVCRCVRTEVEDREPSVYEGATDIEEERYNKRHPYRLEYDNRDIYKTSNNYTPYCLDETQDEMRQKRKQRKDAAR